MSNKREYVIGVVLSMLPGTTQGDVETLLDRLSDEGLLTLGYGDVDIDRVVQKFTDTFGTTKVSKADRWAANRLVKKYGAQSVTGIIGLLGSLSDNQYAPVVNNIAQLEDKWTSVLNFIRKQGKDSETIQL